MSNVKHIDAYTAYFKNWQAKELGAKPTETQLAVAHVFGRPGKQSLAVAMALRDGGVSGTQIKLASGLADGKHTPQLNHMRSLIAGREFERLAVPGVYALKITKTGQARIDAVGKADTDKPVKAAKPAKVKKAKADKVDAAPVAEIVVADQPAA